MNSSKISRRAALQVLAASGALLATSRRSKAQDNKSDTVAMFQNPLFDGDYPDPTILRVGEDFYITHSSFRYAPGLLVWHSRDLVNWTPISAALQRAQGNVWAPDLIEHDGRYFIYYPVDGHIFVVHADHPRGPWSEPIDLKFDGIDPGHVVAPDGTRLLYVNAGNMIALRADGLTTQGETRHVYDGWQYPETWVTECFCLESPKFTRRGNWYYLISAQGGTSGPPTSHMSVVARAVTPYGPWENSPYNPLVHTYSADEKWWSVGHGTLVSTPDERWFLVHHGYENGRRSLGRRTLLEPIEWTEDGWPRVPLGTKRAEPMPAPLGVAQRPMIELSDDFSGAQLKMTWMAWNEIDLSRFQSGAGVLKMRAKGSSPRDASPLLVLPRDLNYAISVEADADNGAAAGLGLFSKQDKWSFVELKAGKVRVYDQEKVLLEHDWEGASAHLKIENRHNHLTFFLSKNGRDWEVLTGNAPQRGGTPGDSRQATQFEEVLSLRPALLAIGAGAAQFRNFVCQAL